VLEASSSTSVSRTSSSRSTSGARPLRRDAWDDDRKLRAMKSAAGEPGKAREQVVSKVALSALRQAKERKSSPRKLDRSAG